MIVPQALQTTGDSCNCTVESFNKIIPPRLLLRRSTHKPLNLTLQFCNTPLGVLKFLFLSITPPRVFSTKIWIYCWCICTRLLQMSNLFASFKNLQFLFQSLFALFKVCFITINLCLGIIDNILQ